MENNNTGIKDFFDKLNEIMELKESFDDNKGIKEFFERLNEIMEVKDFFDDLDGFVENKTENENPFLKNETRGASIYIPYFLEKNIDKILKAENEEGLIKATTSLIEQLTKLSKDFHWLREKNEIELCRISRENKALLYTNEGNNVEGAKDISKIFEPSKAWDILESLKFFFEDNENCIAEYCEKNNISNKEKSYFLNKIVNNEKGGAGQILANIVSKSFIKSIPMNKISFININANNQPIICESAFFKSELFTYLNKIKTMLLNKNGELKKYKNEFEDLLNTRFEFISTKYKKDNIIQYQEAQKEIKRGFTPFSCTIRDIITNKVDNIEHKCKNIDNQNHYNFVRDLIKKQMKESGIIMYK